MPFIPLFCCCFASWRATVVFYAHARTHVKPATTHSSREVYWYFRCSVDCDEIGRFLFLPCCKLHAYCVFFFSSSALLAHVSWSLRNPFFLYYLHAYGFICFFLLLSMHVVFCIFFVNVCVVSVLGFGVKVLFTHVAVQCFPLILFSPWSVSIP